MIALMSHHTGIRFAEVGYLLFVIAGVWLVAAEFQAERWGRIRHIVAGSLIAVGGVLLIIAVHWGGGA